MKNRNTDPVFWPSLGVMALFLLGFLLLVTFGARSCRDITGSQYRSMDARALTAYLAASVKANDSRGAIGVEDSAYGQVLVVADRESGYALRYYRYDGQLLEDFAPIGAPLSPEGAQRIAPTGVFSVERRDEALLAVTTDAGRTMLHIRSEEEAAP